MPFEGTYEIVIKFSLLLTAFVLFTIISPTLSLYACIGLLIGILLRVEIALLKDSRKQRKALGSIIIGLLVMVIYISFIRSPRIIFYMDPVILLELPYSAAADFDENRSTWLLREKILVAPEFLSEVRIAAEDSDKDSTELMQHIREALFYDRWHPEESNYLAGTWERTRKIPILIRWLPATTTVDIPVNVARGFNVTLRPEEGSEIIFRTLKYLVAASFPPASEEIDIPGTNQIQFIIPAVYPAMKGKIILEVLSPLFRWKIADVIVGFSLWGGFKWIILLICSVFSDELKKRFIKPTFDYFVSLITQGKNTNE